MQMQDKADLSRMVQEEGQQQKQHYGNSRSLRDEQRKGISTRMICGGG
jgi:hypothetical protein